METRNHSKNGTKLLNLANKSNLCVLFIVAALAFSSCATYHPQKMKADFVGFSDDVTKSYYYKNKCIVKKLRKQSPPYDLIYSNGNKRAAGEQEMQVAVYGLRQGIQTAAYYALNDALDRVEYVQRKFMDKDPKSKYYVIMLTDGIDTKVADKNAYNKMLQERMSTLMKKYSFFNLFTSKKPNTTNSFESYVLLYKGKDLKETNLNDDQLRTLLTPFAGFQNAPKDEDRIIIKEDITELVDILEEKLVSRSFRFKVPVGFNGENIRMVLTPKDKANPIYFEGDFSKEGNSYYLRNLKTSDGFTISSKDLWGYEVGNGLVQFEAKDLKLNGKPYKVNKDVVHQWHKMLGTYVFNSEYSSVAVSYKNAYLIVILDGSLSFREKFSEAQGAIMRIVEIVSDL
jgi:hypothetical protein